MRAAGLLSENSADLRLGQSCWQPALEDQCRRSDFTVLTVLLDRHLHDVENEFHQVAERNRTILDVLQAQRALVQGLGVVAQVIIQVAGTALASQAVEPHLGGTHNG